MPQPASATTVDKPLLYAANGTPMSFGAPARGARDGHGGEQYAVIPLPSYPTPSRTLDRRKDSIVASYSGRWQDAVDLYRGTVEEDGFFCGILDTMAHGLIGLPQEFQGDPEMSSALLDADGTAGDYAAMHPQEECAKIMRDGLGLGLGLGQYLLMCWCCGYTDMTVLTGQRGTWEVCQRCDRARLDRPVGRRELHQLQWRDLRWVQQNPVTFQYYYQGRNALTPIVDGDGEWFMYRTVPSLESWRHGAWIWATLAAIFSRDSQYDAQNTSAVCAPTPVLRAVKPTSKEARADAERRVKELAFDNRMVLSGEWIYEIVGASVEFVDICEKIVSRCSDAFETGLTGNVMGRSARAAFTDASIYKRTTGERREFYGSAWTRQIREKGLVWWALDNYGTRNAPVGKYDVRSPEDKLAASKAVEQEGLSLKSLKEGLEAHGLEADPKWLIERLQRLGIRVQPKAAPSVAPAPSLTPPPDISPRRPRRKAAR